MATAPPTDSQLYERFLKSLQRFQHLNGRSTWTLLSKSRFLALDIIKKESDKDQAADGVSVSAISKHIHSSMPATSRVISSLEKQELITRTPNLNDRRNILVNLTPKGMALHDEAENKLLEYMTLVVDAYGAQRTENLMNELSDLGEVMATSLDAMRERYPELRNVAHPPIPPFVCRDMDEENDLPDNTSSDPKE